MALPALIQAAIARIRGANNNMWNAVTNPLGHGQGGHRQNFIPDLNAVADIGVFASDCVEKTAADVATTHADVALTHQDASNTALDRIASAQNVTAAAGEVTKAAGEVTKAAAEVTRAKNEADRSKGEAERAKGYANGLNIPSLNPTTASKFLRANAVGDAYEFGEISAATAPDIIAGTGKGFANAETLGPILKSLTDLAALTADKVPPVGSYMFRMAYSPAPGPNWLEAKGQTVSLLAYPDLATALPILLRAYGTNNPSDQATGPLAQWDGNANSGVNSRPYMSVFEGNRFASIQANRGVFQDPATGKNFDVVGVSLASGRLASSGNINNQVPPIIRDNNEIVYLQSGSSGTVHVNMDTAAGIAAGEKFGNNSVDPSSNNNSSSEGLYKLPNGTLIHVSSNIFSGNTRSYQRIWRLAAGAAYNAWQSYDPITTTTMPVSIAHWQTKNGTVYIVVRAYGGGVTHTVYRTTDGGSWANLGTVTLPADTDVFVKNSRRREANCRPFGNVEQSADGQEIIVQLLGVAGFLVSSNAGLTWSFRQASDILGLNAAGYVVQNDTFMMNYAWDTANARWIFSFLARKQGASNQQYLMTVWAGSKFSSVVRTHEVLLSGYFTNAGVPNLSGFVCKTAGFTTILWDLAGNQFILAIPNAAAIGTAMSPDSLGSSYYYVCSLTGIPFDGYVIATEGQTLKNLKWIWNDDTPTVTASVASQINPSYFSVSADGLKSTNITNTYSNSYQYVWMGPFYEFNPATERKLPTITIPPFSGGDYGIRETYRLITTPPRVFMRVK